ncbi:MAG: hypothetical protein ABI165_15980 [Bryobacteraceae bacterium]
MRAGSDGKSEFFDVFGHNVNLGVLGFDIDTMAYFAQDFGFPRNVLGRRGWFDRVQIGILHYDTNLYLGLYGD